MAIICWDLDDTLGDFSGLENGNGPFQVREGIPELLEECKCRGLINVLTTNATLEYAKRALQKSGLAPYFTHIFDRRIVMEWQGKKYRQVQVELACEDELIIIGNSLWDKPLDVNEIFILDTTSPRLPAYTLKYLLCYSIGSKNGKKRNSQTLQKRTKNENTEKSLSCSSCSEWSRVWNYVCSLSRDRWKKIKSSLGNHP